jgi:hypothetical protein
VDVPVFFFFFGSSVFFFAEKEGLWARGMRRRVGTSTVEFNVAFLVVGRAGECRRAKNARDVCVCVCVRKQEQERRKLYETSVKRREKHREEAEAGEKGREEEGRGEKRPRRRADEKDTHECVVSSLLSL